MELYTNRIPYHSLLGCEGVCTVSVVWIFIWECKGCQNTFTGCNIGWSTIWKKSKYLLGFCVAVLFKNKQYIYLTGLCINIQLRITEIFYNIYPIIIPVLVIIIGTKPGILTNEKLLILKFLLNFCHPPKNIVVLRI